MNTANQGPNRRPGLTAGDRDSLPRFGLPVRRSPPEPLEHRLGRNPPAHRLAASSIDSLDAPRADHLTSTREGQNSFQKRDVKARSHPTTTEAVVGQAWCASRVLQRPSCVDLADPVYGPFDALAELE